MSYRVKLAAILLTPALAAGIALVAFAQGAARPPSASATQGAAIKVASSSTNLQSFLWVMDDNTRTITFCFSTSSPETAPQYDFGCRTRPMNDATTP